MTHLRTLLMILLVLAAVPAAVPAYSHGSVTAEDDLCIIRIGFYRAHFKVFQPQDSGQQEFCEDLPATGESIFVMEYLHQELGKVPIDFRIIRDVTGLGRFARLEDVRTIEDIEAATVFYQSPTVESDVFTVLHEFQQSGDYLGIVTTRHPDREEYYQAVFPFEVGYTGFGLLPLFLVLLIITQLGYWLSTGGYGRWQKNARRKAFNRSLHGTGSAKAGQFLLLVPVLSLLLGASSEVMEEHNMEAMDGESAMAMDASVVFTSDGGGFKISYSPELNPIVINDIHHWTVHVETTGGDIVENATIQVSGGMPLHNHGMPTSPRVTEYLGNGDYLVEGMRFHMMGDWEVILEISHNGNSEAVTIPLKL